MTLREVSSQLFDLSVDGFFNREKFSRRRLHDYLRIMLREPQHNAIPNTFVLEIALPDGWWHCTVSRFGTMFDYWIPDTRDQESRLLEKLAAASGGNAAS